MVVKLKVVVAVILFASGLYPLQAGLSAEYQPKDTIIIQSGRNSYIPFTFITPPLIQVTNNELSIAVNDRTGDMIQVNHINIKNLKTGTLPKSAYRVLYLSQKQGTFTDDNDVSSSSVLELKCRDNKTGTPLTIGLKTTVTKKGKSYRIYATLSGIIPSYTYQSTLSK